MQLSDFIDYRVRHGDTRGVVLAVADWLEEQARTPDLPEPSDSAQRLKSHAYRGVASDLRDQTIECWQ